MHLGFNGSTVVFFLGFLKVSGFDLKGLGLCMINIFSGSRLSGFTERLVRLGLQVRVFAIFACFEGSGC